MHIHKCGKKKASRVHAYTRDTSFVTCYDKRLTGMYSYKQELFLDKYVNFVLVISNTLYQNKELAWIHHILIMSDLNIVYS